MAHAAVAGWSGAGDAATHYNAGITASMEEWLGAGVDASAYLAQPAVAYAAATAGLANWSSEVDRDVQQCS